MFAGKDQNSINDLDNAVPTNVPSIVELKKALPKHCFQPSLSKSLYFVAKDLLIVAILYCGIRIVDALSENAPLIKYIAYPLYWYFQGTMMWALFVLGHDCGHGSFSNNTTINDLIGNFLHGFIMVPYYPWKLSHQHHHKNTGNIDKDEIFYPIRETDDLKNKKFLPYFGLGVGWLYYLAVGYSPRACSHLNPFDPLFIRHAVKCMVSITCCGVWLTILLTYYNLIEFSLHYGLPVLVFGSWLVITTFLHHQEHNVPWYSDENWDFVRGNLSSVDRNYGWAHDLVHNIGTHQIHHLFVKIPHYYLEEATSVFRQQYPHLVRISHEPILPAFVNMFSMFNSQQYIASETKIHVFKNEAAAKKAK